MAIRRSRDLVTPGPRVPREPQHDWQIPQPHQALATPRDLVTPATGEPCRSRSPDGQCATPAPGRRARGHGSSRCWRAEQAKRPGWRPCSRDGKPRRRSTAGAHRCDGRGRKTPRTTCTCAVPPWPSPLPNEPVERDDHLDRTLVGPESEEDQKRCRRRPSETVIRRRRTGGTSTFRPAERRQIQAGAHSSRSG